MATLDQILSTAHDQIGYVEEPVNNTKFGAYFKTNPAQWCGLFIMWLFAQNNHKFPNTAYTPNGVRAFKSKNAWHTTGDIQPGDIVYFDFPNDGLDRVSHVGIAVHQFDNGDILTIEGNTSGDEKGDQRNGGMVAIKRRYRSHVVGWGRPQYKRNDNVMDKVILAQWQIDHQPKPVKKTAKKTTKPGVKK